jgi:hypothetical protein
MSKDEVLEQSMMHHSRHRSRATSNNYSVSDSEGEDYYEEAGN